MENGCSLTICQSAVLCFQISVTVSGKWARMFQQVVNLTFFLHFSQNIELTSLR